MTKWGNGETDASSQSLRRPELDGGGDTQRMHECLVSPS